MIKMDFSRKILKLPPAELQIIRKISRIAHSLKERVYLVGGFARDLITGASNFDIDCVTEGDGVKLAEALESQEKTGSLIVNRKFRTAKLVIKGLTVDIASARRETYNAPGCLPKVSVSSIKEDALRRDFTINALYISINKEDFGKLSGSGAFLKDLKNGVIRVFHKKSFIDDATRIYRALRFAARLGFTIEPKTKKYLREALRRGYHKKISAFRIKREFFLMLEEPDAAEVAKLIFKMRIAKFIIPQISPTAVEDLKKAQSIWFDFFIYFFGRAEVSFFYFLVLLRNAASKEKKRIADFFALPDLRKKEIMFPLKNLNAIIKSVGENNPEWPFMLDKFSAEMILYLLFIAETERHALSRGQNGKIFKHRILDYIIRLRFKKVFHSGNELLRMGFPAQTIGGIHRSVLKGRRSGEINSKLQEYDFLVRKLKKM
ncbi:MAG: hypothetical protein COT16_01170 [Elusimicrobia bacterium CG08_land_8_20_14_0_20_44_26]|nr:MAG: hypothetical protein COT16_01170 [Elusimicrobia bacterium CG08_land_8_20_14_0_20_44_26]